MPNLADLMSENPKVGKLSIAGDDDSAPKAPLPLSVDKVCKVNSDWPALPSVKSLTAASDMSEL